MPKKRARRSTLGRSRERFGKYIGRNGNVNRLAMILTVVILPAWVLPAPADGIFGLFGKKTKVNPAERVPELIAYLKTEQDDRKRASAAAELGTFDGATFAEIVPVLVDALQNDPKYSVRMDAASSLGTLRPVSQMAGQALEKAASSDESFRVRLHAKGILMKYRVAGYAPSKGDVPDPNGPRTVEPPLLETKAVPRPQSLRPAAVSPAQFPTGPAPVANTSLTKVPTAAPPKDDSLEFRPSLPRPLPQGPTFTTAIPQQTIQSAPAPLPMVNSDGPSLTPLPQTSPDPQPPKHATGPFRRQFFIILT